MEFYQPALSLLDDSFPDIEVLSDHGSPVAPQHPSLHTPTTHSVDNYYSIQPPIQDGHHPFPSSLHPSTDPDLSVVLDTAYDAHRPDNVFPQPLSSPIPSHSPCPQTPSSSSLPLDAPLDGRELYEFFPALYPLAAFPNAPPPLRSPPQLSTHYAPVTPSPLVAPQPYAHPPPYFAYPHPQMPPHPYPNYGQYAVPPHPQYHQPFPPAQYTAPTFSSPRPSPLSTVAKTKRAPVSRKKGPQLKSHPSTPMPSPTFPVHGAPDSPMTVMQAPFPFENEPFPFFHAMQPHDAVGGVQNREPIRQAEEVSTDFPEEFLDEEREAANGTTIAPAPIQTASNTDSTSFTSPCVQSTVIPSSSLEFCARDEKCGECGMCRATKLVTGSFEKKSDGNDEKDVIEVARRNSPSILRKAVTPEASLKENLETALVSPSIQPSTEQAAVERPRPPRKTPHPKTDESSPSLHKIPPILTAPKQVEVPKKPVPVHSPLSQEEVVKKPVGHVAPIVCTRRIFAPVPRPTVGVRPTGAAVRSGHLPPASAPIQRPPARIVRLVKQIVPASTGTPSTRPPSSIANPPRQAAPSVQGGTVAKKTYITVRRPIQGQSTDGRPLPRVVIRVPSKNGANAPYVVKRPLDPKLPFAVKREGGQGARLLNGRLPLLQNAAPSPRPQPLLKQ